MIIERLSREDLKNTGKKMSDCESLWQVDDVYTSEEFMRVNLKRQRETVMETTPGEEAEELTWEYFEAQLKLGRVAADMFFLYRIKNDLPKCPECGASFHEEDASLSRVDNHTLLCSNCGNKEAVTEYYSDLTSKHSPKS